MRTRGAQSLGLKTSLVAAPGDRADVADTDRNGRPDSDRGGRGIPRSAVGGEIAGAGGVQVLDTPEQIQADPAGWVDLAEKEIRRRRVFNRQVAELRPRYTGLKDAYRKGRGRAPAIMEPREYDVSAETGDRAGRRPCDRKAAAALERLLAAQDLSPHAVLVAVIEMLGAKAVASPYHPDPALPEALKYRDIALDVRAPFIRDREARHDLTELRHASVVRPCHFRFRPDLVFLSLNAALVKNWGGRPDTVLLSAWSALPVGGHLLLYMAKDGSRPRIRLDAEKIGPALHLERGTVLLLRKRSDELLRKRKSVRRGRPQTLAKRALARFLSRNRRERTTKTLDALDSAGTPVARLRKLEHARLGGRVPHHVVTKEIFAAVLPHLERRWDAFWTANCKIRRPDELQIEKPGRPGQYRTVYSFRPLDRLFLGVVHLEFADLVEPTLSDIAVGGRPGRGLLSMVKDIQEALRAPGAAHAVLDVQACFDSIPHDHLEEILAKEFPAWAAPIMALLRRLGPQGVGQGSPLGPLLANLYLDRLVDRRSSATFLRRWVDDYVLVGDRESLETVVKELRGLIRSAGLAVSPKTPGLIGTGPLAALGLLITADHITISKERAHAIEELVADARSPLDHETVAATLRYYRQVMDEESFHVTLGQAQERHQEALSCLLKEQYPDIEVPAGGRAPLIGSGPEAPDIWAEGEHDLLRSFLENDGSDSVGIAGVAYAAVMLAKDMRSGNDDGAPAASSVGSPDWWNDPDVGKLLKEIDEKTRLEARPSEAVAGDGGPIDAEDAYAESSADEGAGDEVEGYGDADDAQGARHVSSTLYSEGVDELEDEETSGDTQVNPTLQRSTSQGSVLRGPTRQYPVSCATPHHATCEPTQSNARIGATATGAPRRDVKRPSKESPLPIPFSIELDAHLDLRSGDAIALSANNPSALAHVVHQLLQGFQNQAGLNRMALCVPPSMDRYGNKADDGTWITPCAGDEEWSGPRLFYTLEQDPDEWRQPFHTDGPAFNFLLPSSVVGGRHPSLVSCDAFRCLPYGVGAGEFDELLRRIAGGLYEVVAVDLSIPGSAGGRDPAMLARSAARRLIKACDDCERRHPEMGRPTLVVMLPPRRSWIDGTPAGISDREFVEDHFDAWFHAERKTDLNTPRWSPDAFFRSPDSLVPPKVIHDYAFTTWRDGVHAQVNASFLVFAKDEAALRGGVRVGEWDWAGRMLDLLGLRDEMPGWMRELSLEQRRQFLLSAKFWEVLRAWLRRRPIPSGAPRWLRNALERRRPAPSPYGLRTLQPAGAAAASAQEHWRTGRKNEVRVARELGLELVPGSGSGAIGGDADNSTFVAEIKHTKQGTFRIHGEDDLDKIARTALDRGRLPLFVIAFAVGGRVILVGERGGIGAELGTKTIVVRPGVELEPFTTKSDPGVTWRMISKGEVAVASESATLMGASPCLPLAVADAGLGYGT